MPRTWRNSTHTFRKDAEHTEDMGGAGHKGLDWRCSLLQLLRCVYMPVAENGVSTRDDSLRGNILVVVTTHCS